MEKSMQAYCGTYCGTCAWREKTGCKGCKANAGEMFWGTCDKAKCCIAKGLDHCGDCGEMPCAMLQDLFNDPEHGDGGERLRNLQSWRRGEATFQQLNNAAQETARRMEPLSD